MNRTTLHLAPALRLVRRAARDNGQVLVEYSIILLLVALVVIAILTTFGGQVSSLFSEITTKY